jgi:hypothetical protein
MTLKIFLDDKGFDCLKRSIPAGSPSKFIVGQAAHLNFYESNTVISCDEAEARNLLLYASHCPGVVASREVHMSSALDEFKKPMEEWARSILDEKPMENLLILYKLLYALGCRIDGIEFEIDRLCLAAIKKAKALS